MFEPKGTQYKNIVDKLNAHNAYHGTNHVRNCANAESIGFRAHVAMLSIETKAPDEVMAELAVRSPWALNAVK
jgi:hypothetical protein